MRTRLRGSQKVGIWTWDSSGNHVAVIRRHRRHLNSETFQYRSTNCGHKRICVISQ
jgi:hypothetical protein